VGRAVPRQAQRQGSAETFETALQADPRWVPALVGYAAAMADDDPGTARASLDKALAIDPNCVAAHLWLAEQALNGRRLADAGEEIGKVLAVNPDQVEALSLQAAIAAIEDRTADAEAAGAARADAAAGVGRRLSHHRRPARPPTTASRRRSRRGRKAMEIEPADPRTQAALGMHLLRTGDEAAARTALDAAFRRDPFDVVTYNSLSMLDTLDRFETIATGDLILKIHPEELALMRDPVEQLARKALADLGKRYNVTPRGPVLIEMFPRHDDFAVRTLGLPGMVGALGACFGRVVTLDSPRARPPGLVQLVGDAVARARPCGHPAAVEPARAALAHRRRLGVRGAPRRPQLGPRGRDRFPARLRRPARRSRWRR
jgi:tetratricopeptide (TPR) repeat protein